MDEITKSALLRTIATFEDSLEKYAGFLNDNPDSFFYKGLLKSTQDYLSELKSKIEPEELLVIENDESLPDYGLNLLKSELAFFKMDILNNFAAIAENKDALAEFKKQRLYSAKYIASAGALVGLSSSIMLHFLKLFCSYGIEGRTYIHLNSYLKDFLENRFSTPEYTYPILWALGKNRLIQYSEGGFVLLYFCPDSLCIKTKPTGTLLF